MCCAIACDCDTVVGSRCSPDCVYTVYLCGDSEDAWVSGRVVDDVVFVEGVDLESELEAVEAAPDEQFAGVGDGDGVVCASFDVCYSALVLTK